MEKNESQRVPRSTRNNNPLNIRRGEKWLGLSPEQTDSQFCRFLSAEWGWRAAFMLLTRTYYHKYKLYTVRRIIQRWAPPVENNTDDYVKRVVERTGLDPDVHLGIPSVYPHNWLMLACAMAEVESGRDDWDFVSMLRGWQMAKVDASLGKYT